MSKELNKIMGMVCKRERMYYNAAKVDAILAEKDKEIESLKASHYAEMVDAGMRERRLRRALYKVCAMWAHIAVAFFSSYITKDRWRRMEVKCRAKAEEYK